MGTTYLVAATTPDERISTYFTSDGRGAFSWRNIVDAFDEALERLPPSLKVTVSRDRTKRLGQGAKVTLSIAAFAKARATWERDYCVQKAIESGQLVVRDAAVDEAVLIAAIERARGCARATVEASPTLSSDEASTPDATAATSEAEA